MPTPKFNAETAAGRLLKEPGDRPTAHELLQSDQLPKKAEDEVIQDLQRVLHRGEGTQCVALRHFTSSHLMSRHHTPSYHPISTQVIPPHLTLSRDNQRTSCHIMLRHPPRYSAPTCLKA
jgi:hypothetical protein